MVKWALVVWFEDGQWSVKETRFVNGMGDARPQISIFDLWSRGLLELQSRRLMDTISCLILIDLFYSIDNSDSETVKLLLMKIIESIHHLSFEKKNEDTKFLSETARFADADASVTADLQNAILNIVVNVK